MSKMDMNKPKRPEQPFSPFREKDLKKSAEHGSGD
jgi:hypothetical protein